MRYDRFVLFQGMVVLLVGAFATLTFLVRTMDLFTIDLQITRALQSIQLPAWVFLMRLVSWPGFAPQALLLTGIICLIIYRFDLHWEALIALTAAVVSTGINLFVKDLVQRPRPTPELVNVFTTHPGYSFPSGHVMFYLVFFGFIGFLTISLLKSALERSILLVFLGSLIFLIGPSRIYLGEHWASDVLGSYLLGSLTLLGIIQVYLWGKTRSKDKISWLHNARF